MKKKYRPIFYISKVIIFVIPVVISLFILSYYNLKRNNFFFLFPTTGTITHYYSILSTIDNKNIVSPEYQTVYDVFLKKKSSIENEKVVLNKGSLLNFIGKNKIQSLTIGWKTFADSEQELFDYYNLQGINRNRAILAKHLSGFYKQIEKQNRIKLLTLRISSFLMCLRANNITLPDEFGKTNLNILPYWIIIGYKIFIIIVVSCFYLLSAFFVFKFIRFKNLNTYFGFFSIIIFVLYFPLTGILTADVYNITRYKFLSEPLIIGLIFYYLFKLKNNSLEKVEE